MKEEDIRPKKIFDEYLRLAAQDAKAYFSGVTREYISCPACGNRGEFAFEKFDFTYDQCQNVTPFLLIHGQNQMLLSDIIKSLHLLAIGRQPFIRKRVNQEEKNSGSQKQLRSTKSFGKSTPIEVLRLLILAAVTEYLQKKCRS